MRIYTIGFFEKSISHFQKILQDKKKRGCLKKEGTEKVP